MGRLATDVITDGMKKCSLGNHIAPVSAFHADSTRASGLQSACHSCRVEKYGKGSRNSAIKTKYGITQKQYDTMYEEQEGRCLICKTHHEVLCIDHNHDTKKVRGLICRECNFGLGKFGDDPNRLMAAIAYLLSYTEL